MVSTSARNAGGPWFDSRSRHDRLLYANSVCLYNFLHRGILYFFNIYIYIYIYIYIVICKLETRNFVIRVSVRHIAQ